MTFGPTRPGPSGGSFGEKGGSMDLHLTPEEAKALRVLLTEGISDLSPEIADTDNAAYRSMLRHRREVLRNIHQRLSTEPAFEEITVEWTLS
jgi:hypothetical protein